MKKYFSVGWYLSGWSIAGIIVINKLTHITQRSPPLTSNSGAVSLITFSSHLLSLLCLSPHLQTIGHSAGLSKLQIQL